MKQSIRSYLALTKASMKMYYRNKGAIVFSLLIPVALLSIFGFLSRGTGTPIKVGLTDYGSSPASQKFVEALRNVKALRVQEMDEADATDALGKGNLDIEVIVPKGFGTMEADKVAPASVRTLSNSAKPQSAEIASLVIVQIVSDLDRKLTGSRAVLDVKTQRITSDNRGYFDFILPGILAMTIMQLGIFGVAFSFVALKASGALRRLQATPVHPIYFVFAQATVRLLVTLATAVVLVVFGTYFFGFHMVGSYVTFGIICILGILIFLGFGFAIAGWARDETQVAPVANLIQLPMLLLSGIFFSREGFPPWLKSVTDYFPLTYVSDGLRKVANEGASLAGMPVELIGIGVWLVLVYVVAVRLFRWE